MKARIVIGANYGDEGKGTVVASLAKKADNVLNVLTNGGSQRGHSILTKDGSVTFQHFGSGTYFGADNYYSRFFILNPIQFAREHEALIVKPRHIYRDRKCLWSTPFDIMANQISEESRKRQCSCGMGVWNTIKRHKETPALAFDDFMSLDEIGRLAYLRRVKGYYERSLTIPGRWKPVWDSPTLLRHFISDCVLMWEHTFPCDLKSLSYDEFIFENGQGLLLCDTGKDTSDTTPSNTGVRYALDMAKELGIEDITAHYVTRPYLTRHGDGPMLNQSNRRVLSASIQEDRTNHYNANQGEFRYGMLDIPELKRRIEKDAGTVKYEVDLTHCDEIDREPEFRRVFDKVNYIGSPLI